MMRRLVGGFVIISMSFVHSTVGEDLAPGIVPLILNSSMTTSMPWCNTGQVRPFGLGTVSHGISVGTAWVVDLKNLIDGNNQFVSSHT